MSRSNSPSDSTSTPTSARSIEQAVDEELALTLGAAAWQRTDERRGYRNGSPPRTLTGPSGPRAHADAGKRTREAAKA